MRSDPAKRIEVEVAPEGQERQAALASNDVVERGVDRVGNSIRAENGARIADQVLIEVDGRMLPHPSMICMAVAVVYAASFYGELSTTKPSMSTRLRPGVPTTLITIVLVAREFQWRVNTRRAWRLVAAWRSTVAT